MMYQWQVEKEDLEALHRCGFTTRQIRMLYSLRTTYMQDRMDQPALDIRRLEFARFLVATGRLTEEQEEV